MFTAVNIIYNFQNKNKLFFSPDILKKKLKYKHVHFTKKLISRISREPVYKFKKIFMENVDSFGPTLNSSSSICAVLICQFLYHNTSAMHMSNYYGRTIRFKAA